MTNAYKINAFYAVSKAKEAVQNWEAGVAKAKEIGANAADLGFCEESLRICRNNLEKIRKDVKENWTAYL